MTTSPPGPEDADYDALFADIVSRWNEPAAGDGDHGGTTGERREPHGAEGAQGPGRDRAGDPGPGGAGPRSEAAGDAAPPGGSPGAIPEPGGGDAAGASGAPGPDRAARWVDDTRAGGAGTGGTGTGGSGTGSAGTEGAGSGHPDPGRLAWRGPGAAEGTGWRVHVPPPDDEDEEFTPPARAPLPTGDPTFWGALIGLVAGPLWLLYLVVAAPYGSKLPVLAAIALTIGGFALLVSRLPRRRTPDDDDTDDGAVV